MKNDLIGNDKSYFLPLKVISAKIKSMRIILKLKTKGMLKVGNQQI